MKTGSDGLGWPEAVRTDVLRGETSILRLPLSRDHLAVSSSITPDGRLLVPLLAVLVICPIARPLYPLFAMAFAALAQLRRKYGPAMEPDEGSA